MKIRQPIVTVAGHVDHGKTSILDMFRGTSIQEDESGGITQKISFTKMDKDTIKNKAGETLEKFKIPLEVPGFLFIDTPGHSAFTNLRSRGGSLADLAVLVIDINDGIKPQTAEVLKILKNNKTPFVIALNKIDNISGWRTSESKNAFESVENQPQNVKQSFEEKFYTLVGSLNNYGFDPELYYKIKDFTKNVAVVPTSANTGEGINELLAMLLALSQKFLIDRMKVGCSGKGVVLEVKKDKNMSYLECILYDGELKRDDYIAIAGLEENVVTKVRCLEDARPLNKGYEVKSLVEAASGLRIQTTTKEEILPGMPFQVVCNNLDEIERKFSSEFSKDITTDPDGVYVKADSLGSLEALLVLLREKGVRVLKTGIGSITKKDIYSAKALPTLDRFIIGFNVDYSDNEVKEEVTEDLKVITGDVVYKLIDDFEEEREKRIMKIERGRLESLPTICKLNILDFVFRNSNPAVFGVMVVGGTLKKDLNFINFDDEKIGHIKEIQHNNKNVSEAGSKQEVAISMPGVNVSRQLSVGENLYTNLGESQFRQFKENKDLLSSDEKKILQEIAQIKRRSNVTWGDRKSVV